MKAQINRRITVCSHTNSYICYIYWIAIWENTFGPTVCATAFDSNTELFIGLDIATCYIYFYLSFFVRFFHTFPRFSFIHYVCNALGFFVLFFYSSFFLLGLISMVLSRLMRTCANRLCCIYVQIHIAAELKISFRTMGRAIFSCMCATPMKKNPIHSILIRKTTTNNDHYISGNRQTKTTANSYMHRIFTEFYR